MNPSYDPVALEILKMARELVINEYTDRRAQDHNKWLADFEVVWKNNRIRLPYPDIPPYPTETQIVARAQVLLDFLKVNHQQNQDLLRKHEEPKPVIATPPLPPAAPAAPPAVKLEPITQVEDPVPTPVDTVSVAPPAVKPELISQAEVSLPTEEEIIDEIVDELVEEGLVEEGSLVGEVLVESIVLDPSNREQTSLKLLPLVLRRLEEIKNGKKK